MPAAVSRDGRRAAFLGPDNTLRVWDVAAGHVLGVPIKLQGVQVTPARFSPDGRWVVTGDGAGGARVWDATTGRAVTPPLRQGGSLVAVAFSADGKQLTTVGKRGTLCTWELPCDPEARPAVPPVEGPTAEDLVVPAAPRFISIEDGTTIQVKRAVAGGSLRQPRAAGGVVVEAVFSRDGQRVVVTGKDGITRLWATATGQPTATLRHGAGVGYAAFSPDGVQLLTAAEDRTVRLWDAVSGEVLSPPRRQAHAIRQVFFHPTGNKAVIVCEGGIVDAWDLTPDMRPTTELCAVAGVLSCSRIENQERQALDVKSLQATWKLLNPGR
jgi:WD40 repeat protein